MVHHTVFGRNDEVVIEWGIKNVFGSPQLFLKYIPNRYFQIFKKDEVIFPVLEGGGVEVKDDER